MDFWSRLIRGGNSQKKGVAPPGSPQVRLAHVKRAYNSLLQIWHNGDGVSDDAFVVENVRICLHRLAGLLNEDQRGPTPHLCVSFAATSRILVTVARITAAFQSDAITQEALHICSLLIDSEEEAFLEDRAFAETLPEFIESIQKSLRRLGDPEIQSSMVELLFSIAAKLRLEPHILRVWFRPEKPEEDDEELDDDERRTRWEEFPLFYMLLHYVPFEGRSGEFGRMGLLYIVEMAAKSSDLEKWLVGGDMSALMASGLGALYSQLSRKLALKYPNSDAPSILTFSDRLGVEVAADAESTVSPEYQAHLGTFLASLVFWQDLLEHCTSDDVKQTLLDHFQYLFLQQLLYPSLLESSDVDGGSSVAVLTYLRHILESIDHPDLVRLTLQYLFGLKKKSKDEDTPRTAVFRARRRKSQNLIARLTDEEQFSPDLFNLSDLIMASLRSNSQQTITATLRILSAMLRRPHHQSLTTLLRTRAVQGSDNRRTIGGHEKEIEKFLSMAEDMTAFQDLESSYEQHIFDNRNNLESHACSMELLKLPVSNKNTVLLENEKTVFSHKVLVLEDPTFQSLIALLNRFFHNDIETNLGLTEVLIDLASCGYMRLEGWLLTSPKLYQYPNQPIPPNFHTTSVDDENARDPNPELFHRMKFSRLPPTISPSALSPIIRSLNRLTKEVSDFRRTIPSFETHLLTCRNIIDPSPSANNTQNPTPSRSPSRANTQAQASPLTKPFNPSTPIPIPVASLSSRILSSGTPTRTASPRGRQEFSAELGTPPSLVSRLGHLQTSPSCSPSGQSAAGTPSKSLSRSPLRQGALAPPTPAPAVVYIPEALRRRIRLDDNARVHSRRHYDIDESDSDTSETSSIAPGEEERSPISPLAGKEKNGKLDVPARCGHKKSPSSASVTSVNSARGRDGAVDAALANEDTSSEAEDDETAAAIQASSARSAASREGDARSRGAKVKTKAKAKKETDREQDTDGTVALGHLLTNVIILQEFALEAAAVVEVRGALFEEVRYF